MSEQEQPVQDPEEPRVHYAYFGRGKGQRSDGTPEHEGVVSVAYEYVSPEQMAVAFAFCMPGDSFYKTEARIRLLPRLRFGKRRCKKTGTHVQSRFLIEVRPEERAEVTICRAFNETIPWGLFPRSFKDWILIPVMQGHR